MVAFCISPPLLLLPGISPQATVGVRRTCAWTATGVTSCQGTAGSVGAVLHAGRWLSCSLLIEVGVGGGSHRVAGCASRKGRARRLCCTGSLWQPSQKGSRQGSDSILHLSLLRRRCFQMYLHSMNSHFMKKYNFKLKKSLCRRKYCQSLLLQGGG